MAILFINEEILLRRNTSANAGSNQGGNTKKEPFFFYAIRVWEFIVYILCAVLLPVGLCCLLGKAIAAKIGKLFHRRK